MSYNFDRKLPKELKTDTPRLRRKWVYNPSPTQKVVRHSLLMQWRESRLPPISPGIPAPIGDLQVNLEISGHSS